jgi:hypothetical protein
MSINDKENIETGHAAETDEASSASKAVEGILELASQGSLSIEDLKNSIENVPRFIDAAMETIKELSTISTQAHASQSAAIDAIKAAQSKTHDTLSELAKQVDSEEAKMRIAEMLHTAFMQLMSTLGTMNQDNNKTFGDFAADAAKTAGAVLGIGTILALATAGAAYAASVINKK